METYDKLWSEYNKQLKTVKTARYSLLLEIKDFYELIGKRRRLPNK